MQELRNDWIYIRDGHRELRLQVCDSWERVTMLASLSSDPRSLEELAVAWSRYRPDQPLLERDWEPALKPGAEEFWLGVDLTRQSYVWNDPEPIDPNAGGMRENVDDQWHASDEADNALVVWLNVPPWWTKEDADRWSSSENDERTQGRYTHVQSLDFRSVLYGRPLVEYIAGSVCAVAPQCRAAIEVDSRACDKLTKKMHAAWLMTQRGDLEGATPRYYLHLQRDWKDREIEYRRTQWTKERRPPPPVSNASHLFRFGPMGTEEVVTYFELCRELFQAAWLCMSDDPKIDLSALIAFLELTRDSWMEESSPDLDGCAPEEVIEIERQLMPRQASCDPIDCDCPLCRMQSLEPELFGPSFTICDGFQLEMEGEFAFSLIAEHDCWEEEREIWNPCEDDSEDSEEEEKEGLQWGEVWRSSYVASSPQGVTLSLFAIGTRLAELVGDLQTMKAEPAQIDSLNGAFGDLGRAIRQWLVEEATDADSQLGESTTSKVNHMIGCLEAVAFAHPELTAKSADLQSLVHHWQRQLTA